MLEIFIPTKIHSLEINVISKNFFIVLKTIFSNLHIKEFEDEILSGVHIFLEKFDYDLVKLANGEFGEFYFIDYDKTKYRNIFSFATSFSKFNQIEKNILKQGKIIESIQKVLDSDMLLTKTKKAELQEKLQKIFFSLSGILFVLLKNKELLEKNNKDLKNYKGLSEYEAQAKLFLETTKTKKIELQKSIDKFSDMLEMYLGIIEKIFIK